MNEKMENKWKAFIVLVIIVFGIVGTVAWKAYTKECDYAPCDNSEIYRNIEINEALIDALYDTQFSERGYSIVMNIVLNNWCHGRFKSYRDDGTTIETTFSHKDWEVNLRCGEKITEIEAYRAYPSKRLEGNQEKINVLLEEYKSAENEVIKELILKELSTYDYIHLYIADEYPIKHVFYILSNPSSFVQETLRQLLDSTLKTEAMTYFSFEIEGDNVRMIITTELRGVPLIDPAWRDIEYEGDDEL